MTKKILFVDDEQSLLNGIERRLGFDYEMTTANSGPLGLEAIREHGPFAVIVTDMRMPGMDGVQFITEARKIARESIYVMLTGNQDQGTATQAVNEGRIFRFLNKPCESDLLRTTLDAALRQHQLETGEKELLWKTFSGAVSVLTDVLEITHPDYVSSAGRMEELVSSVRGAIGLEDRWEYHMAAKLSLIGLALLPNRDQEVFLHTHVSENEWLEVLRSVSEVGQRLIKKIPRLEVIADMIGGQAVADTNALYAQSKKDPSVATIGASLLRIAIHADRLACCGLEADKGVLELRALMPFMSREIEEALEKAWPSMDTWPTVDVRFSELLEEMVLAKDVLSSDGAVLVRKGRRLTSTVIEKLQSHQNQLSDGCHLSVFEHSCPRAEPALA